MATFEENKQAYARLAVSELNIRKDQRLVIRCNVDNADFARLCAKAAYDMGCKEVLIKWGDDEISRMRFLYGADEIFDHYDEWDKVYMDMISEEGAAFLAISSQDPEALKGVDPDRLKRNQIAASISGKLFMEREMRSDFPWCVIAVPSKAWACKVFPNLSEEDAVKRLWDEILKACRIDGEDTVKNWGEHSDEIRRHVDMLNEYNFKYLKYKNAAGTDVTVELPEGHIWGGGREQDGKGNWFSANIPTEECFTLPKRDGINGKIVATKPLVVHGSIVDGFYFIVKDGKIEDVHADQNEDLLRAAISVDDGASYFGECALVPFHSPISQSNVLFLNTLFDENASCHFAFGAAYPTCLKGSAGKTDEELRAMGANTSMTHDDFMVGSEDMSITGITHDGKEVPVFVNGDFAF